MKKVSTMAGTDRLRPIIAPSAASTHTVAADVAPETRSYYRQLTRFSAAFAFLSDVSMLVLGGSLAYGWSLRTAQAAKRAA